MENEKKTEAYKIICEDLLLENKELRAKIEEFENSVTDWRKE